MAATIYTPKNFAMIAGDELCGPQGIPCAFGYYAEHATTANILNVTATTGNLFFGYRTVGTSTMTPAEKLLPTASQHLTRGSIILINGKSAAGLSPPTDPFVLYVIITSEAGADTEYEQVYLHV